MLGWLTGAVIASKWLDRLDLVVVRDAHRLAGRAVRRVRERSHSDRWDACRGGAARRGRGCPAGLRRRLDALTLVAVVVSTEIAVALVKHLLLRPRPPATDAVVHAAGYSFPSGHAAASLALFVSAASLASRGRSPAVRTVIGAATVSVLGAIGVTRVYLGGSLRDRRRRRMAARGVDHERSLLPGTSPASVRRTTAAPVKRCVSLM